MIKSPKNQGQAKAFFLRWLLADGYNAGIREWTSILENGPEGRKPPPNEVSLHTWFSLLESKEQTAVLEIIQGVASATIFHCLVVMDQGFYVENKRHELSLRLDIYESEESTTPQESFLISPGDEDLHDLFSAMLDDSRKRGE